MKEVRKPDLEVELIHLAEERDTYRDLIRWIAPKIIVRDGNGRKSQRLCLLCTKMGASRVMVGDRLIPVRAPCRHSEIFALIDADQPIEA